MKIGYLVLVSLLASLGLGLAAAENPHWWIPILVGGIILGFGHRQERSDRTNQEFRSGNNRPPRSQGPREWF